MWRFFGAGPSDGLMYRWIRGNIERRFACDDVVQHVYGASRII